MLPYAVQACLLGGLSPVCSFWNSEVQKLVKYANINGINILAPYRNARYDWGGPKLSK